jgi:hypothetical protein
MPVDNTIELALNRWGKIVIGCGLALIFLQLVMEFGLLSALLFKAIIDRDNYFNWKPPGPFYIGVAVLVIGAAMMAFAALLARRQTAMMRGLVEPATESETTKS